MDVKEKIVVFGFCMLKVKWFGSGENGGEKELDVLEIIVDECMFCVVFDISFFKDLEK